MPLRKSIAGFRDEVGFLAKNERGGPGGESWGDWRDGCAIDGWKLQLSVLFSIFIFVG